MTAVYSRVQVSIYEEAAVMGMNRRFFLGTAGLMAGSSAFGRPAAQNRTGAQNTVTVEKDVVFGKGGDMDLKLDIYRPPAGTEKQMATIHFHGGGFTRGSKDTLAERVRPFAVRGYVAIAAQYRLVGQGGGFPDLVHDAKAAIRWTRANAKALGIQPQRIGVVGYSAGGYLALFTAGTGKKPEFEGNGGNAGVGSEVALCMAYYPATAVSNNMMPAGSDDAARRNANSTTHIAAGYPPTVIFHGVEDVTIRLESSQRLFQQFRDAKVPVELHAFEGVPHAFDSHPEFAEACAQMADLFIDRHILNPRTYPPFQAGGGGARGAQD